MIKIQLIPIENMAAILARILVALENIVPSELHFLLRQPVKQQQNDDARHANLP
ncbi:MAG: hypothetical protein QOG67_3757 [Verrucomicrobiota bacterium]